MNNEQSILEIWTNKFNECLGIEFSKPGYFKVHHLLVITFMIQTNAYTKEYSLKAIELLKRFNRGLEPKEYINEIRHKDIINGEKVKVIEPNRKRIIDKEKWNITIMDIRIDSEGNYCKDVIRWAKEVELILSRD